MPESVVLFFAQNPLLLLFVVVALGYPLGKLRVAGASLGIASILFAGIAMGALVVVPQLDPALKKGLTSEMKFVYELGHFEFNAHGESVEGANQGPCYTNHSVVAEVKLKKPGTILASAYCNIHGLWENQKAIAVK